MLKITTDLQTSVTVAATSFEVDEVGHLWVQGEDGQALAVFPSGAWQAAVVVEEAAK